MWKKRDCRSGTRDAFKAVHFCSRLLGLAPYSFVINPQKNGETIDISWRRNFKIVIWSLTMLTVQFVGLIYVISSSFIHTSDSLSDLVPKTLQFPLINATGLVALAISVSIKGKKMVKIVEMLSAVDKHLSQRSLYHKHNLKFTILVLITAVYHTALHIISIYFYPRGHINFYYGVSIYLCDFMWSVNNLQYVNIVEVLTQNLILMNKQFHTTFVSQSHSSLASKTSRPHIRKEEFCFSKVREFHKRDHSAILNSYRPIVFRTNVSHVNSRAAVRILELRFCFNHLYSICRLINSIYGLSLLMDFMAYTVCLTGDLYSTCFVLITPYKRHELISVPRIMTAILWVAASASKVLTIVFAGNRATSEFRKTAAEVHKLISGTRLVADVQQQLDLFSIQLVNNRIEFTACGFFEVNFKLVRTLVYTVTTYIIVLVQVTWLN
jgi:hypothetical protein